MEDFGGLLDGHKGLSSKLLPLREILKEEHAAVGGLYFITTNVICAFILSLTLQLSWTSQVVAMSDNLAYIVAINTAVHSYINKDPAYTLTNPSISIKATNSIYSPLNDFNNMLSDSGLGISSVQECVVEWTGTKVSVQFGEFTTILNIKVRPHIQNAVIETY